MNKSNGALEQYSQSQKAYESALSIDERRKSGVFFTYDLQIIDQLISAIPIGEISSKRILEPACGQGMIILRLIQKILILDFSQKQVDNFIAHSLYFNDINPHLVRKTQDNIGKLYRDHFGSAYKGRFNAYACDFTEKPFGRDNSRQIESRSDFPLFDLFGKIDFVVSNPPFIPLYGRRDQKSSESERQYFLANYKQFPAELTNGKLNYIMLFIEQAYDFLKSGGELSYVVDMSFLESAFKHTRKFLIDNTQIEQILFNLQMSDVTSSQMILLIKKQLPSDNRVKVTNWKSNNISYVNQALWNKAADEHKFRLERCPVSDALTDRIEEFAINRTLGSYPQKSFRTCTMLLSLEDKFTVPPELTQGRCPTFPFYEGSYSLPEKFGSFKSRKRFVYDKETQDRINHGLKLQLESEGVKNKKRVGLGEIAIYENPKVYIRQSASHLIASVDLRPSAANNSLYVFSLRNESTDRLDELYYICGWLNSELASFYARKRQIIRRGLGKQPQMKISDLLKLPFPTHPQLMERVVSAVKMIYQSGDEAQNLTAELNELFYDFFNFSAPERLFVRQSLNDS